MIYLQFLILVIKSINVTKALVTTYSQIYNRKVKKLDYYIILLSQQNTKYVYYIIQRSIGKPVKVAR